ncbi:hypothetical protein [Candidatus Nanohalococcus occultus]|uniref:Uncharacterized protein n=1 Tax=Candidatus Nanohalococcus occultus TaxID=2978047 RepID=A0ABY8CCW6_9ARCH|nr:hypothetical protein SVXNc_0016 [Candidatus Nanohaloarchaeota archaeon SVXNc]
MASIEVRKPENMSDEEARRVAERALKNKNMVSRAVETAKNSEPPNPGNKEGSELCRDLLNDSSSISELSNALESTLKALNQHANVRGAIHTSKSELEEKISELISVCEQLEKPVAQVIVSQLERQEEQIESETSYAEHFMAEKRVVLLENVVYGLKDQNVSEAEEVVAEHKACVRELNDFRDKFVNSSRRDNYNMQIPIHFVSVTSSLLDESKELAKQGDEERARGVIGSSEQFIEAIEGLFTDRRLQEQLSDLNKLRSSNYKLVKK